VVGGAEFGGSCEYSQRIVESLDTAFRRGAGLFDIAGTSTCVDMDKSWSQVLCQRHGLLSHFLVGRGKPYPNPYDV
jgi:hypothetical protein